MHRLHMYATEEISPLMNRVPGTLYELE
jgi:hypothetical protein